MLKPSGDINLAVVTKTSSSPTNVSINGPSSRSCRRTVKPIVDVQKDRAWDKL